MNAIDFILKNTKLKRTPSLELALNLFDQGLGLGEVFFEPEIWCDKDCGFWPLDKIWSAFQDFKTFEKKKNKYLKDISSRQTVPEGAAEALDLAQTLTELEEAFRPYKRKKKTKATLAREAGLVTFADILKLKAAQGENFENSLESEAKKYIQPALGFITYETVLKGAQDILVEQGLDQLNLRSDLLESLLNEARVVIKPGDKLKEGGRYSNFVKAPVQKCNYYLNPKNFDKFPQIKKAWEDGFLKVTLDLSLEAHLKKFEEAFVAKATGDLADFLKAVSKKALEVHLLPSVTTEVFDRFYFVSQKSYLSKMKTDYMSLLATPAFGNKPVLSILEKENQTAAVVFVSHEGEFVSSTTIDFKKEDVVESLKSLINSITANVSLGCVALSLTSSVRKFEKLTSKALLELNKKDSVPLIIADPRGLVQYINQPEAKFGFDEKIDNSSLAGFYLAKRVQDPLYEYGAHPPSMLLDTPHFINKEDVDKELLPILSYYVCSIGLSNQDVSWGLLKNLLWFPELEPEALEDLAVKLKGCGAKEKKDLEPILESEKFGRLSKYFKFEEALNLLDRSRVLQSDFSKIKDFLKEQEVSLLKGPVRDLYKNVDEKWYKLLGEPFAKYLGAELSNPFKDFRKTYKVFSFSKTAEDLEQVKADNLYWGVVTKFSTFGAFVDIGVGVDGLVHLSELSNEYIADARKVLRLGQWVLVKTIKVDSESKKLSFSKIKADEGFAKRNARGGARSQSSAAKKEDFKKSNSKFDRKNTKKNFGDKPRGAKAANRKPRQPFNNPFAALQELKK